MPGNNTASLSYDGVLENGVIGSKDLERFARTVLKLTDNDVDTINYNHKDNISKQRFEIAMKWKKNLQALYDLGMSKVPPSPELLKELMTRFHLPDFNVDEFLSSDETRIKFASAPPREIDVHRSRRELSNVPPEADMLHEHQAEDCTDGSQHPEPNATNPETTASTVSDPTPPSGTSGLPISTTSWTFGDKGIVQLLCEQSGAVLDDSSDSQDCDDERGVKDKLKNTWNKIRNSETKNNVDEDLSKLLREPIKVEVFPCSKEDYEKHLKDPDVFTISHNPKGHVLILNNIAFKHLSDIDTGEHEGKLLKRLFEELDCKVELILNKTAQELKAEWTKFIDGFDSDIYDFCTVFILSHGKRIDGVDQVIGVDGLTVPAKNLVEKLKKADKLSGTPKFVFFEICRKIDTRGAEVDVQCTPRDVLERILPDEAGDLQTRGNVPKIKNILVVWATRPGTPSYCTLFTYALINVFAWKAKDKSMYMLLDKVKSVLEETSAKEQMADYKPDMKKSFFFFPGFPKRK